MFHLTRVFALAALLAVAAAGSAQAHQAKHYRYTLTDLGTLGGPQADVGNGPYINARGVVTGTADTALLDPYGTSDNSAFNGDPYVQHTYVSRNGALADLGALGFDPANNSSYPNAINAQGDLAGVSDNGAMDPLTGTAEAHAVLWKNRQLTNLGTLGGNESQALSLNNRDQVTGVAANATLDAFSMLGWETQARAFLWQDGVMRDLGTLGGPDSFGWFINSRGQVAGVSYTSAIPDPVTKQPPSDVFLWQNGKMRDLGNLGGSVPTFGGVTALNDRGEIVGQSDLKGNHVAHPYLWNGTQMIDLGTLGGDNGSASWVNDAGAVTGTADLRDHTYHAFIWTNGTMRDLRPLAAAPCSNGSSINASDEVVGNATDCQNHAIAAVLWIDGSPVDLNTLIAPSALHLTSALTITDAGQIIGEGVLPNGNVHNFLLTPNN